MITFQQAKARYPDKTDEEIIRQMHKKFGGGQSLEEYAPTVGYVSRNPEFNEFAPEATGGEAALLHAQGQVRAMGAGAAQLASKTPRFPGPFGSLAPLIGQKFSKHIENYAQTLQEDLKALDESTADAPVASTMGQIGGAMLAMPVPGKIPTTMLKRLLVAAAEGAGIGGIVLPREGESRAMNAAVGTVAAGGLSFLGSAVGKGINAAKGRMAPTGNKVERAIEERSGTSPQTIDDWSKETGVSATMGDAPKGTVLDSVSLALDMVPWFLGGTGKESRKKALQITQYLEQLKDRYEKIVADYGTDALETIGDSARRKFIRVKQKERTLWDELSRAMGNDNHVPSTNLNRITKQWLDREQAKGTAKNPAIVGFLKKYETDQGWTHEAARSVRSDLKALSRKPENKGPIVKILHDMIGGIEEDAMEAAKKAGFWKLDQRARKYTRDVVSKITGKFYDKVRDPEKASDLFAVFMRKGSNTNAKQVYRATDDVGRAAMRSTVVKHAFDEATGSDNLVSPVAFARKLREYQKVIGSVFRPEEKEFLKGLQNFLRFQRRASERATPKTGYGAMKVAAATAGIPGTMAAAGTVAAAGAGALAAPALGMAALRFAMGSPAGRRLIRSAADFGPSKIGEAMDNLLRLYQRGQAGAGI